METYQGVKFNYTALSHSCPIHPLLDRLNTWVTLFSDLGLAPVHPSGAYGNQSIRTSGDSFIITRSGLLPERELNTASYTMVESYDDVDSTFMIHGQSPPSSESFLHARLYREDETVNSILHGHSPLINSYADRLNIPVTDRFCDYGTIELAESALEIMNVDTRFFILRDHGFVALGETVDEAGKLTLDYYSRILAILQAEF